MVFFTSIIIVSILYYLQSDGLVYVIVLAMTAELINIFMTQTLTKSIEKKLNTRHKRIVEGFARQLKANRKTIQEFENVQETSVKKIHKANMKIKELEKKLSLPQEPSEEIITDLSDKLSVTTKGTKAPEVFNDLPDGSNRDLP